MLWLGKGRIGRDSFGLQIAVPDTTRDKIDSQVICMYKCVLAALRLPVSFGSLTSNPPPPHPAQSQLRWSSVHDI